jgi:hypothetical protein
MLDQGVSLMLSQLVSIQPFGALDVGEAELVDVAVEGIDDAAHMPADGKGAELRPMGWVSLRWRRGSTAGRRGPRGCASLAACRNLP